jgi:nucleoside-diphosphate-sugar epimerase
VAVTGASGIVGRNIVNLLLHHGFAVRALTRDRSKIKLRKNLTIFEGDLTNVQVMEKLFNSVDLAINCAGEKESVELMQKVNVDGCVTVAESAIKAGVETFFQISSAGVIGPTKARHISEHTPCEPNNLYEQSKFEAERKLETLFAEAKSKLYILRPTVVVDKHAHGLIEHLTNMSLTDRVKYLFKAGENAHIIHATDVAGALFHLYRQGSSSGIYFVGYDEDQTNNTKAIRRMVSKYNNTQSVVDLLHLPASLTHAIRTLCKGKSLHGKAVFSSRKILSTGFKPSMNIQQIVEEARVMRRGFID